MTFIAFDCRQTFCEWRNTYVYKSKCPVVLAHDSIPTSSKKVKLVKT